jgi:hypothetical protein
MITLPPTNPAPIDYASAAQESKLQITRNDDARGGGIVIRVPPPEVGMQVTRIVVWSLGLAALGTSAALRILSVRPPRGIVVLFTAHASFLPALVAALLAGICAWMVVRLARFGRRRMTIAVDDDGIYVDHPTRLLPRSRRIPFERFAAIEQAERGTGQLQILLRDGIPYVLPMAEADKPRVLATLAEELRRRRPQTHIRSVDRFGRVSTSSIPPKRFMRDEALRAQLDTFADGIRWTITPARGWVMLHIITAAAVMWLAVVIIGFVHPIATYTFMQWTAVYAVMMLALFMHETPSQRGRHPTDVVLDVIGKTLVLRDADYHGSRDRWQRDEIAAIRVGGAMWWIARGGDLSVRLTDGTSVTLLHGQPLCVLKPVAQELRRALGMAVTATSPASPPRGRG